MSGRPSSSSATSRRCTAAAIALARLISVRSSASASRKQHRGDVGRRVKRGASSSRDTERRRGSSSRARRERDRSRWAPSDPRCAFIGRSRHAAFRSRSAFHWPSAARLFIMARWAKARCAAATFSGLPDQAFCGACLQRAAVGEGDVPGQRAHPVHGVEMRGGVLVGLAAGQEGDAGHRRRHAGLEHAHASSRRLPRPRPAWRDFLPGTTMFGLSTMPSSATRCVEQLLEHGS